MKSYLNLNKVKLNSFFHLKNYSYQKYQTIIITSRTTIKTTIKSKKEFNNYNNLYNSYSNSYNNNSNIIRRFTTGILLTTLTAINQNNLKSYCDSYSEYNNNRNNDSNSYNSNIINRNLIEKDLKKELKDKLNNNNSIIWNFFKKTTEWLINIWKIIKRMTLLSCYLTPTIISSPVLMIGSSNIDKQWWNLVRYCIFSCGPCITKFAQWAATRPDIFPVKLCKELELLQAHSFQHSWDETVRIFNEVYGPEWSNVLTLDHDSISGSGLVAQVYHGYLKTDDINNPKREVAVKILHPNVRYDMKEDLLLINFLAQTIEVSVSYLTYWYYNLPFLHSTNSNVEENRASFLDTTISLQDIVNEFESFMTPQLDLRNEVIAMQRFQQNFQDKKWKDRIEFAKPIEFPLKVLNSTNTMDDRMNKYNVSENYSSDILLETYLDGLSMTDYLTNRKIRKNNNEIDSEEIVAYDREIAALGLDLILKMIFDDNFVHGDLHPGNILILPNTKDKPGPRFQVLDYGLTTELTPTDRQNLILLFKAVINRNGAEVGRLMIEKSRIQQQVIDSHGFEQGMQEVIDTVFKDGLKLRNSGVSQLLQRVLQLCYKHRVRMESNFSAIVLSLGVVEGLGIQLDPDADVIQRATPFIIKTAAREYGLF